MNLWHRNRRTVHASASYHHCYRHRECLRRRQIGSHRHDPCLFRLPTSSSMNPSTCCVFKMDKMSVEEVNKNVKRRIICDNTQCKSMRRQSTWCGTYMSNISKVYWFLRHVKSVSRNNCLYQHCHCRFMNSKLWRWLLEVPMQIEMWPKYQSAHDFQLCICVHVMHRWLHCRMWLSGHWSKRSTAVRQHVCRGGQEAVPWGWLQKQRQTSSHVHRHRLYATVVLSRLICNATTYFWKDFVEFIYIFYTTQVLQMPCASSCNCQSQYRCTNLVAKLGCGWTGVRLCRERRNWIGMRQCRVRQLELIVDAEVEDRLSVAVSFLCTWPQILWTWQSTHWVLRVRNVSPLWTSAWIQSTSQSHYSVQWRCMSQSNRVFNCHEHCSLLHALNLGLSH